MSTTKCPQCFRPIGDFAAAILDHEERITEFCQPLCAIKWNKNSSGATRLLLKEHRTAPVKAPTTKPLDYTFIK